MHWILSYRLIIHDDSRNSKKMHVAHAGKDYALQESGVTYDDKENYPVKPIDEIVFNIWNNCLIEINYNIEDAVAKTSRKGREWEALGGRKKILKDYKHLSPTKLGDSPLANVEPKRIYLELNTRHIPLLRRKYAPNKNGFIEFPVKHLIIWVVYQNYRCYLASGAFAAHQSPANCSLQPIWKKSINALFR